MGWNMVGEDEEFTWGGFLSFTETTNVDQLSFFVVFETGTVNILESIEIIEESLFEVFLGWVNELEYNLVIVIDVSNDVMSNILSEDKVLNIVQSLKLICLEWGFIINNNTLGGGGGDWEFSFGKIKDLFEILIVTIFFKDNTVWDSLVWSDCGIGALCYQEGNNEESKT